MRHIKRYVLTCGACPTQYDFFTDAEEYIYFRFRHGYLSISENGIEVYCTPDKGDGVMSFDRVKHHMQQAGFMIDSNSKGSSVYD